MRQMASLRQTPNSPAAELRTIIVTGASSGIGAYCTRALKAEGWRVFATARKPEDIAALEAAGSGIHVSLIEPGSVKSKIASNGLPWFLRNIDHENSTHRADYAAQLERMRAGGSQSARKPGPEVVHKVLRHALLSRRPRPHYV